MESTAPSPAETRGTVSDEDSLAAMQMDRGMSEWTGRLRLCTPSWEQEQINDHDNHDEDDDDDDDDDPVGFEDQTAAVN